VVAEGGIRGSSQLVCAWWEVGSDRVAVWTVVNNTNAREVLKKSHRGSRTRVEVTTRCDVLCTATFCFIEGGADA